MPILICTSVVKSMTTKFLQDIYTLYLVRVLTKDLENAKLLVAISSFSLVLNPSILFIYGFSTQ